VVKPKSADYYVWQSNYTPYLKKLCKFFVTTQLRQISTNFDKIWQKDGKEAKLYEMHSFPSHLIRVITLPC